MSDSVVQIGPYRFGKTLGVGSFSKVKRAVHIPTGRKVAVKILNRQLLKSLDMGAKARREIDILRLFNHPHIIRLYEVIETPTDLFVVMEHVNGGELFDYIVKRGRLSENEARRFFQQIISGVEYCHTHMVVHRDLKPENLLLDENLNVKIADFGLSNIMKDGFFLHTSCGSPNYAAPEVISGQFYAGPEVDVWSCGVILYALLCGSLPFDHENISNLFKLIKTGTYSIPDYLSDEIKELITRMLVVDPIQRISIEELRANPWFKVDIPRYIEISSQKSIEQTHTNIDEKTIDKVAEMNYDKDKIREALSLGPDLLTKNVNLDFNNRTVSECKELRQMAVAYHLMYDYQRSKEAKKCDKDNTFSHPSSAHTSPKITSNPQDKIIFNNIEGKMSHLSLHGKNYAQSQSQYIYSSDFSSRSQTQWYLGIWTSNNPSRMMQQILKTLKKLDLEWKEISPYKIKARYKCDTPESFTPSNELNINQSLPLGCEPISLSLGELENTSAKTFRSEFDPDDQKQELKYIKIALQLYGAVPTAITPRSSSAARLNSSLGVGLGPVRTTDKTSMTQKKYILDIQKLVGEIFPFMDLCAKIIAQLESFENEIENVAN